ncbi:2-polyprenyl-6-methoxyphenol hydroxylase-like FAD-dependent oxidoreductase [Bradyrhizobium japonicum]
MQFHLNGFQPGDPEIADPAERVQAPGAAGGVPDEVDVLIVGCGPAGLTLAAQLAQFPDIKTCIVEQKPGRLSVGQADGVACRTMEMFHAFGFSERVLKEAYWVNETTFWKPDERRPETIVRSGRVQDVEDGLSEFPHVILNQARIHDGFLDVMRKSPAKLEPYYSRRLLDLQVDPASGPADHAVTVRLERVDAENEGKVETIRARYVVGCDGARSTVRKSIGRELHGDSANHAWGVMDVLAVTDFPDIRFKALIQSAKDGSLLIIPREGGYMVRIYVELAKLDVGERVASRNITADDVIAKAQRILKPHTLDVKEIAWWSVYEIGQRLTDKFDDVPEAETATRLPRIFIAGDACHTHSPKAGQGMNVSMQDAFNLGWKLAAVLRKQSAPSLLHSYSRGAPGGRERADRLRPRMVGDSGLCGQGRWRRCRHDAGLFCPARPLYGRHRDALHALGPHGGFVPSASCGRPRDRQALPFRAGDPAGRRKARSSRPRGAGRRTLPHLCIFRRGESGGGRLRHSCVVQFSHRGRGIAGEAIHPRRRRHRRRDRSARGVSARSSRACDRGDATAAAAAQRPLRFA